MDKPISHDVIANESNFSCLLMPCLAAHVSSVTFVVC